VGQVVSEGDPLCALEAMKMELAVRAPFSGVVTELHAFQGAQVEDGRVLVVIQLPETAAAVGDKD
jgi:biotin carboxyl carrier protein